MSCPGIQDAMQYSLTQCHCLKDAVKFSVVYCAFNYIVMYITNKQEEWSNPYSE